MECLTCRSILKSNALGVFYVLLFYFYLLCQNVTQAQRLDRFTCERRPTHTRALKSPGDNGFSIKIIGSPPPQYYEPGKDYEVFLNGSYMNQQFLDFMLVVFKKNGNSERDTAGTFTHMLNHMTREDEYCSHVMTSVTFHPSYKKSSARFTWTAPPAGTGCVIFKGTVIEHPDIWFSDDGGLTKMFCEKPADSQSNEGVVTTTTDNQSTHPDQSGRTTEASSSSTNKRRSSKCCACDVAKYEVTFVGNWTRESHPKDFPTKQYESLLHWSDIIGASHSPSYSIWSYDSLATTGVKEVCEYGWPRTLEGEIKHQGRNVRTVIKANGIWGYPALYTSKRNARFSTDNERPFISLLSMIGPSPDWCVGIDSINLCLEDCTWKDQLDVELYPWDAGTDSGVTYLSNNLPTYPREKIRPITNTYPNNTASPFYGNSQIKPMATVRIRRIGSRQGASSSRCEAQGALRNDSDFIETGDQSAGINPKCMTTEWSEFSSCSVTCGVGIKSRSRQFKHPMGSVKMCPYTKIQESDNCLGLVNECDDNPDEPVDICITTPWSSWSPCSATCGNGSKTRTRQYLSPMGTLKCSQILIDSVICSADISDCNKAAMMIDWQSVCKLPADPGRCIGTFPRFFYDTQMGKCRQFNYGGCRGNRNKFDTREECENTCAEIMKSEEGDSASNVEVEGDGDADCMVTEWTPFTHCSVSCGTGMKSRSRMIKRRNHGNGERCPKDLYETRVCASQCPTDEDVDCMLSEWTHWSDCSVTCDDGLQTRQRMIKRPPQGQGQPCEGDMKGMRECNLGNCIVEDYTQCMLSEWSGWSDCSEQCGIGKMMRRRMQKRGPCSPDTVFTEAKPCTGDRCSGQSPVNCVISSWSDWTRCDQPCDLGSQTRFRMVIQPASRGGSCELDEPKQIEKRTCYLQSCDRMTKVPATNNQPIDCQVGEWGAWSACSKTCGTGRQLRYRPITQKRRNGGARCPKLKQRQRCRTGIKCLFESDCELSEWSVWTICHEPFTQCQMQARTRSYIYRDKSNNETINCLKNIREIRYCNEDKPCRNPTLPQTTSEALTPAYY